MTDDTASDEENFEQVLNRLDALMKRNHPPAGSDEASATPPQDSPEEPAPTQQTQEPFFIAEPRSGRIPVLTEIYLGELPEVPDAQAGKAMITADELIASLLPMLMETVELAVREESERMRQTLVSRLQDQIAVALQQRLLQED